MWKKTFAKNAVVLVSRRQCVLCSAGRNNTETWGMKCISLSLACGTIGSSGEKIVEDGGSAGGLEEEDKGLCGWDNAFTDAIVGCEVISELLSH